MAPPQFQFDPFPSIIAGAMTAKCECGWEMVFIMPEEHIMMLQIVFAHLKEVHHIELPTICCFWH